jgi:hypothetical protein
MLPDIGMHSKLSIGMVIQIPQKLTNEMSSLIWFISSESGAWMAEREQLVQGYKY